METIELIGYYRPENELGTKFSKQLRREANVPCVLYGGEKHIHFYMPMILFRDIVYSSKVYKINLNIEGDNYMAILQDVTFHPVSEIIYHADFLALRDDREVKVEVPIQFTGTAMGITKGGKFVQKMRKVKIKALPANLPAHVTVDVTDLDLGKNARVSDISAGDFTVLMSPALPVASVIIPRALKSAMNEADAEA